MPVLKKDAVIPLGRMMFIPKQDNLALADLVVETEGQYILSERGDCFVIKNDECCRGIKVTVRTREEEDK